MGGRKTNLDRTLRIRYKKRGGKGQSPKIGSSLYIGGSPKKARKAFKFKKGRVLAVSKVSVEERLKIGEHSTVSQMLKESSHAQNAQQVHKAFEAQHQQQKAGTKRLRLLMDRL